MSFSDILVKLEPIACGLLLSDRPDGMLDALRLSRALSSNCMLLSGTFFVDLVRIGISLAIIPRISRTTAKVLLGLESRFAAKFYSHRSPLSNKG